MATHSSTLAWKIPRMEEPGGLQSMGSLSQTWLSNFTFTFHLHALEKEMATHSSVLAWRIPGTAEPGGLLSVGSHRVRHDWRGYFIPPPKKESFIDFVKNCFIRMMRAKVWLQYGEWMDGEQQKKKINVNKDTEKVIICLLWARSIMSY